MSDTDNKPVRTALCTGCDHFTLTPEMQRVLQPLCGACKLYAPWSTDAKPPNSGSAGMTGLGSGDSADRLGWCDDHQRGVPPVQPRIIEELTAEFARLEKLLDEQGSLAVYAQSRALELAEKNGKLHAEVEALKEELASVLSDWNDLVAAIGSKTNGGAIGHAKALVAENAALKQQIALAGWKLVPVKATDPIKEVLRNEHDVYADEESLYAALLNAAAPSPEAALNRLYETSAEIEAAALGQPVLEPMSDEEATFLALAFGISANHLVRAVEKHTDLEKEKERFEAWTEKFYAGLATAAGTWNEQKNTYQDFAHHIAWHAYRDAKSEAQADVSELVALVQVMRDTNLGEKWVWPGTARETWLQNADAALAKHKGAGGG